MGRERRGCIFLVIEGWVGFCGAGGGRRRKCYVHRGWICMLMTSS